MRVILAIVAAAALGWIGWWFFIANAKEAAIADWLAERRAEGWTAQAEAIEVGGFPYRVDTTLRGLELANPKGGWAWTAPEFQFLTLAYQPNQLIAIWPPAQRLATPFGETEIRSETMRGSLEVEPNLGLALERATVETASLTMGEPGPEALGVARAVLAIRQAEGEASPPFAHDLSLEAETLTLPARWTRRFDRAGLAPVIERASFEGLAVFDRPWDRAAVEGENPGLEALVVRDLAFTWGRLDLRGKGELRADEGGFAEGRIDLRARNWREMLDLAETSGALGSGVASALRGGLGLLARLGSDPDTLEAPLEFSDGAMRLGPVPLGPAPRMNRP